MIPLKTVNDLINKHALLEKELSSSEIDKNSFAEKSKEYSDLCEIIKIAKIYVSFEKTMWRLRFVFQKISVKEYIRLLDKSLKYIDKEII